MSNPKSLQEKFKNFFKQTVRGLPKPKSEEYILTAEIEAELKSDSPLGTRLKAIKEFHEVSRNQPFELYMLEKLWILLNDLLKPDPSNTREIRHLVFDLFTSICKLQVEKSGPLRARFFNFIKNHNVIEDSGPRFEFLKALTEDGKDITYFEEKVGPLIHAWLSTLIAANSPSLPAPAISEIGQVQGQQNLAKNIISNGELGPGLKTKDFMSFLVVLIRFNQAFLDQEVLSGILQNVCFICCTCTTIEDSVECLNVLHSATCYSSVPPACLSTFLATLCRTVNVEQLCQTSWKIMRNLLGTHLGHSGLLIMCQFMETSTPENISVIRGSIFFVGISLWGQKWVRSLRYEPTTVLSSFSNAMDRRNPLVNYEVIMRIQDLIRNKSDCLQSIAWDHIIEIVDKVVKYSRPSTVGKGDSSDKQYEEHFSKIILVVNETLDEIEIIINAGGFGGSMEKFYTVIESCADFRPEVSVDKLLNYKLSRLLSKTNPIWLNNLVDFVDQHYRLEKRSSLKSKTIQKMGRVALLNLDTHEEEIIDKVILPYFKNLDAENESIVRQEGANFIIEFLLMSTSRKGHDLLSILERVINRPFDLTQASGDTVHIFAESEIFDILICVKGLVRIFERKIYHLPSSIAVSTYKILVRHMDKHYKRPTILEQIHAIRYSIFECYFRIRANSLYHLGFPKLTTLLDSKLLKGQIVFSPYLAVDHSQEIDKNRESNEKAENTQLSTESENPSNSTSNSPGNATVQQSVNTLLPNVTHISLTAACKLVVSSLRKEKDWRVLELILVQLPKVLENKALILSKHGNDIDFLATALCSLMLDNKLNLPDSLRNLPKGFKRSDFQTFLFPILTTLVSYHNHLDRENRVNIIKCLKLGLVSNCSQICILSLSICTLEMKDTMHKLFPEILLSLSKISPKINIAIPILEFLSTLIHLPRVFASLLQDQYLTIFAIALPYTNPFKFNQYTVSLAHHVIAMWFLKCRLSYRKSFVSFIMKGLESNVFVQFEEQRKNIAGLESRNEDSSNRKRSSSLTDNTRDKRRERSISGQHGPGNLRSNPINSPDNMKLSMDKNLMIFHQELTETCIDLMARYAFADCSALPTRFNSTNFLLCAGNTMSWLMDNKIITIATSGCTQKELRSGLCDKCWLLCKNVALSNNTSDEPADGSIMSQSQDEKFQSNESIGLGERSLSVGGVNRRRHRSAFAGSPGKKVDSVTQEDSIRLSAMDDILLHHPSRTDSTASTSTHSDDSYNEIHNDENLSAHSQALDFNTPKIMGEHLCTCWCQGWAEIHIRRPTGNISWMMRVQNEIGNYQQNLGMDIDVPLKELSTIFIRNILQQQSESQLNTSPSIHDNSNSNNDSNASTPTPLLQRRNSQGAQDQDSFSSPKSPSSPTSIDPTSSTNTATEEGGIDIEQKINDKMLVRRSNSSPEMTSSFKNPFFIQQRNIEEQDEDDSNVFKKNPTAAQSSKSATSVTSVLSSASISEDKTKTEQIVGISDEFSGDSLKLKITQGPQLGNENSTSPSIGKPPAGSVSPFRTHDRRSHDPIPEEFTPISPVSKDDSPTDNAPPLRDRLSTISVMTPARRNPTTLRRILSTGAADLGSTSIRRDQMFRDNISSNSGSGSGGGGSETGIRSGISPSFVFLQLCAQGFFGNQNQNAKPLLIPTAQEKSLKVLDYIPPYETHKIGVLYIGHGQASNEAEILQNPYGSVRYRDFLQGLGALIKLREIDPQKMYIGGLSRDGTDGEYAYIWQDDVMQVIFHVATLMPNNSNDPSCNAKWRHIGNDYVAIVYNNSEEDYDISSLKGQFLYACVIIQPLDHKTNRVIVKAKPNLTNHIGHTETKIVSDQNLPILARQLALHSNLASVIFQSMQRENSSPYASNWLERLRSIKRLKIRLQSELAGAKAKPSTTTTAKDELQILAHQSSSTTSPNPLNPAVAADDVGLRKNFYFEDFTEFV